MKTDDLIAALTLDVPATPPRMVDRDLALWMIPSGLLALGGVVFWLGLRPDLSVAVMGPTFWAKTAYTLALGVAGFWLLGRAGRPGSSARGPLILLVAILILVGVLAVVELVLMPGGDRMSAIMGQSWRVCAGNILVLSAASAPFVFFAARVQQQDQRRQHGDRQQERHDHADARDLPQLGDAGIGGGQE